MLFPSAATNVRVLQTSLRLVLQRNFGLSAIALQQTQRKGSDPIQQLFLDKIRDYASKEKYDLFDFITLLVSEIYAKVGKKLEKLDLE